MASTYTPIATTTASGSSATITFSSIPSTYTDLVLIGNFGSTQSAANVAGVYVNGDTATNYSNTYVTGNGTAATSAKNSNTNQVYLDGASYIPSTITAATVTNFQNYSNTTTYKTILSRYSAAGGEALATVGLWRSTSAINSISIVMLLTPAGNFLSGSTFTLYGIKAA